MSGKGKQQEETAAQKAMMEFATKQYRDYKVRQLPMQRHLAAVIEANNAPDSAARQLAEGKASVDAKVAFAKARTGLEAANAASGAAPGSARANLSQAGLSDDQAGATGMSQLIANQQADDAYTQGLSMLTALGRGERANVAEGLAGNAASSARQSQLDAEASLNARAGNAELLGQFLGTGMQQAFSGSGGMKGIDYGGVTTNRTGVGLPTAGGL